MLRASVGRGRLCLLRSEWLWERHAGDARCVIGQCGSFLWGRSLVFIARPPWCDLEVCKYIQMPQEMVH